jgi:hypothetical protein
MHAQGRYNTADTSIFPEWVAAKAYNLWDRITHNGYGYECTIANNDNSFDITHWRSIGRNGDIAFVIGNGSENNNRSNALTVKWDGSIAIYNSTASGISFAGGWGTTATNQSHAEGSASTATGWCSHAEG